MQCGCFDASERIISVQSALQSLHWWLQCRFGAVSNVVIARVPSKIVLPPSSIGIVLIE